MDAPNQEFVRAASLEELEAKGRLVVHGHHRPVLVATTVGASSPATIAVRTWAPRSNAVASRTGF